MLPKSRKNLQTSDDLGATYTDDKIRTLEKAIKREYGRAQKEIQQSIQKLAADTAKEEQKMLALLKNGAITQERFDQWKAHEAFRTKSWETQEKNIADTMYRANTIATQMVRGEQYDVFAFNANYAAYSIDRGIGGTVGFDLYSKESVARLLKDKPNILPFKKLDKTKDEKWNFKNIRSEITQGILQGKSIPKIAEALSKVVPNRNAEQMVKHARTAMTSAQNGGRMERYRQAEDLGIKMKKVWVATLDSRTRETHRDLDGQAVDVDEDFTVDGMKISFPGDPHADPSMTYLCRCTMITRLADYPASLQRRVQETGEKVDANMTYREWEKLQNGQAQEEPVQEEPAIRRREADFTPAESIKEAEEYAQQFLGYNGKVSYSGIDLEYANACNKALADVHENFDVSGLGEIQKMNMRSKLFQGSTAEAAYKWGSGGLYINPTYYKSPAALSKHLDEINGLMDTVLQNGQALLDSGKYTGKSADYLQAIINSGRQCVSQSHDFVQGNFIHECGHMLDDKVMFRALRSDLGSGFLTDSMKQYGGGISGYAVSDTKEYVAESFTAWWFGEGDKCDPKIVSVFEGMMKK